MLAVALFPVVVCSVGAVSVGVLVVCSDDYLPTIIRTCIHTRIYTYTRTRTVIFRP